MNATSCLSLPNLHLPTLHVEPFGENVWEDMTYIPVVSNLKGAFDILIGTAILVASVSLAIITVAVTPFIFIGAAMYGTVLNRNGIEDGLSAARSAGIIFTVGVGACAALTGVVGLFGIGRIVYGVLESIPVVGNLALGFFNGRIQIIPQNN